MRRDRAYDRHADRLLKGGHRNHERGATAALFMAPRIVDVDFDDRSFLDTQRTSRPRGLPSLSSLTLVVFNARTRSEWVNFGNSSPAGSTTSLEPSSRISTFPPALTRICLAIAEGI